jgi:GT2 family glycosyltransferase
VCQQVFDSGLTKTARVRLALAALIHFVLPTGTKRRRLIGIVVRSARNRLMRLPSDPRGLKTGSALRVSPGYAKWLRDRQPSQEDLVAQRVTSSGWSYRPMISVCMPVHDPDPQWLDEAISSVQSQSYENWELCIGDDASTRQGVTDVLGAKSQEDSRIRVVVRDINGGISRATNSALGLATGEYVAFLDNDDFIAPHTLYLAVKELQADPTIDMFYCDEDLLTPRGKRVEPVLKPGWSPELLLSMNYITHFVIARRAIVEEVGGMRPERDGGQDHDLVLRVSERTGAIHHIPEVLYTWRQSQGSTSMNPKSKPWAFEASVNAVRDALDRRGVKAQVRRGDLPGQARVAYDLPDPPPHVEILIPTRDRVDLLKPCIDSIRKRTKYENYSISIVDNDSRDPATLAYLRDSGLRVLPAPGPFNYSAIVNGAIAETDTEFILTLNNDTHIQQEDWLRRLLELCVQPDVGAVGCRLILPSGRVQHEGIVMGRRVPAANLAFDHPGIRIQGLLKSTRDVSAVTGACCLTRKSAWEKVGGLDESLPVAYNDVDYCLRLRQQGYRVLYTPHVTVVHAESASRGALHPLEDERLLRSRWGLNENVVVDPFFSPRLVLGPWGWQLTNDHPIW